MKLSLFATLLVFALLVSRSPDAYADTIRQMQYNLLYYTDNGVEECNSETNNLDGKDAALKKIIGEVKPDILTVNEIGKDSYYADRILYNVLNTDGVDYYGYLPVVSNPNSFYTTTNRVFYDTRKLALKSSFYVATSPTYINGYRMYYRSQELTQGDTVFITFIVAHLKAGSDEANVATRQTQVQAVMNKLQSLGRADNYVFSGDLNLYGASEPAYQTLVHNSNAMICFRDPIDEEGEWNNNGNFADIFTQSTHTSTNGCYSAGGMDDRFDFILVSDYINSGLKKVKCLNDTYHAFGQDGSRFNGSIVSPANTAVSTEIAHALYLMSDHLPVVMDYRIDAALPVNDIAGEFAVRVANPVGQRLNVFCNLLNNDKLTFEIYSMEGRLLQMEQRSVPAGDTQLQLDFPHKPAFYLLKISDGQRNCVVKKLVKL